MRIGKYNVSDAYLYRLIKGEANIAQKYAAYGCSTEKINCRCNPFSETEGMQSSGFVSVGLGSCMIALLEKKKAASIISAIGKKCSDRFDYERNAAVFTSYPGLKCLC